MRLLASIQEVNAVESIPNADAIERIRILGWWVVSEIVIRVPGEPDWSHGVQPIAGIAEILDGNTRYVVSDIE